MGNNKLTINQWAEEDRPREKMMQHGAAALSNAELLAILIGSGNTEDSAVELMRKVLGDYRNSLSETVFVSVVADLLPHRWMSVVFCVRLCSNGRYPWYFAIITLLETHRPAAMTTV